MRTLGLALVPQPWPWILLASGLVAVPPIPSGISLLPTQIFMSPTLEQLMIIRMVLAPVIKLQCITARVVNWYPVPFQVERVLI